MVETLAREQVANMEIREKMRDPNFLPTHADFHAAFPPTEEGEKAWQAFCINKEDYVYELINKEHIDLLAGHIVESVEAFSDLEEPVVILEVGAGNGKLSRFLQQRLNELLPGKVKVIPTGIMDNATHFKLYEGVENLDCKAALDKYQPTIVISSWMPYEIDFTEDFRNTPTVKEYILIGEDTGCCGDPEKTWGTDGWRTWSEVKPWEKDGFDQTYVRNEEGNVQICRADSTDIDNPNRVGQYSTSRTMSFKRK